MQVNAQQKANRWSMSMTRMVVWVCCLVGAGPLAAQMPESDRPAAGRMHDQEFTMPQASPRVLDTPTIPTVNLTDDAYPLALPPPSVQWTPSGTPGMCKAGQCCCDCCGKHEAPAVGR
ncbi:MAG: hypothetical protein ACK5NY_09370 [Burkholderiaceae bacterium]|jgi:hypothetical protein